MRELAQVKLNTGVLSVEISESETPAFIQHVRTKLSQIRSQYKKIHGTLPAAWTLTAEQIPSNKKGIVIVNFRRIKNDKHKARDLMANLLEDIEV